MSTSEQLHGVGILPLRISVWKQLSDVAGRHGTKDGIDEGVGYRIAEP